VFALAMAVTSIPVISRIMADLGILGTRFARILLSVAVLEDLLVYVVLNLALALVAPPHAEAFSLPSLLSLRPASILGNSYYIVVTLAFFTSRRCWIQGSSAALSAGAATSCTAPAQSPSSSPSCWR
jgi:Kef-type K+ transport system membrane component KefB